MQVNNGLAISHNESILCTPMCINVGIVNIREIKQAKNNIVVVILIYFMS